MAKALPEKASVNPEVEAGKVGTDGPWAVQVLPHGKRFSCCTAQAAFPADISALAPAQEQLELCSKLFFQRMAAPLDFTEKLLVSRNAASETPRNNLRGGWGSARVSSERPVVPLNSRHREERPDLSFGAERVNLKRRC